MKFSVSAIFDKYANSSRQWLLPLPIMDDGTLKLICYMSDEFKIFNRYYVYQIEHPQMIVDFFKEKSLGQAYNKFILCNQDRSSFFELNHETDVFITSDDIIEKAFIGKTAWICNQIDECFKNDDFDFNLDAISESESKSLIELKLELAQWEQENLQGVN